MRRKPNSRRTTIWHDSENYWELSEPFLDERSATAAQEIDQLIALTDTKDRSAVLDLCCGTGRHSLELARRGFIVTGVDRTPAFLSKAKSRAESEKLQLDLINADMREFRNPNSYSLALNMFSSFGYFENASENLQVLHNVFASLEPGGKFVLDIIGKEVLAMRFRSMDKDIRQDIEIIRERKIINDWKQVESQMTVTRDSKTEHYKLQLWLYSGAELADMLQAVGFKTVALYGSFAGTPYDQTAQRLLAISTK